MSTTNDFWFGKVMVATEKWPTPFFLCAWEPVEHALSRFRQLEVQTPVRHWLSVKTQPVKPLLRRWAAHNLGAEVVSEFELRAAVAEGFHPRQILVNGVAKHVWLPNYPIRELNVHFDSITEVSKLAAPARELGWRVGLRLHLAEEFDPDEPNFGGQFGLTLAEAKDALDTLRIGRIDVAGLHFHLRSNIESPSSFQRALSQAASFCEQVGWRPAYLDVGGGLPDPEVTEMNGRYLSLLGHSINEFTKRMGSIEEVWMENGRFVTGGSAVLVMRIVDSKSRPECRYILCDGGRTNHALVSDWEAHSIHVLPKRTGQLVLTTVSGPTCMAFDRLARLPLPSDVSIGDLVVWMNAGAYHLPWETRFSRGVSRVLWCSDNQTLELARDEETFSQWWGQWL